MSHEDHPTPWKDLAKQASKELDSARLLQLVAELNRALEDGEHNARKSQSGDDDPED